jgi:2-dehydro-3-deoxygluconokinase
LFIGENEARALFRANGSPVEILMMLGGMAPNATIALLQGQDGSTVWEAGQLRRPTSLPYVQVVDPVGAGDAYVAGYLWAILSGRGPQEAVDAASTIAALKCSMWGDIALITERDLADFSSGGPDIRR